MPVRRSFAYSDRLTHQRLVRLEKLWHSLEYAARRAANVKARFAVYFRQPERVSAEERLRLGREQRAAEVEAGEIERAADRLPAEPQTALERAIDLRTTARAVQRHSIQGDPGTTAEHLAKLADHAHERHEYFADRARIWKLKAKEERAHRRRRK